MPVRSLAFVCPFACSRVVADLLRIPVRMLRTPAHVSALATAFNGGRGHGRAHASSAQTRGAWRILEKPQPIGQGARPPVQPVGNALEDSR